MKIPEIGGCGYFQSGYYPRSRNIFPSAEIARVFALNRLVKRPDIR